MAYTLKTLLRTPYGATAATALAQAIHDAFVGGGWAQTSDTGQVNLSSWPSPTGAYGAYLVFKPTDSLQTTSPFFVRVDFWLGGDGDGQTGLPLFTVGTSTNGAGTITGNVYKALTPNAIYAGESPVPQTCYFCADTGRFAMALLTGPTDYTEYAFGIERTKDPSSGADTADGMLILTNTAGGIQTAIGSGQDGGSASIMLGAASLPSDQGQLLYWPAAVNLASPTMATSSSLGVALPVCFNVKPYPTGYNFLLYQGSDFAAYSAYGLVVYGTSHNYIALSGNAYDPTLHLPDWEASQAHLLMRFE